ncbi:S66 family peptidase [Haloarcula marismortui]|uniref:LD-carboxypeptidase n=1 Tax=Haloarcula marismortui ATCC 33800 TaxID=662476 RepID=A0A8T8KEM3_9EURY|nr:S66 peptidase family protein [Haloarcula sinaiiensis]QUJ72434.1 LD-carboxypeptidase [Haloarcula sinaiiensis ATCC 33800]
MPAVTDFLTPPHVEPGDRVAVVAPASNAPESARFVYELGLERMCEVFDLDPVAYPTATADPEWLADNPEARAEEIMKAFRDPDISAVIANIGGHDQITMLPFLDGDVLREHPTRFYGYSDNTNLALFLWNHGIVSYYGGSTLLEYAMDGEMFDYTKEYLRRALFEDSVGEWTEAEVFTDESGNWEDPESVKTTREIEHSDGRLWRGGEETVSGRIWGGCYAVLVEQFLADRYLPDPEALNGTVLALETSELIPDPAVVGANLRALGERGLLERFDGVLVGRACARSHAEENPQEWREEYRERQRDTIADILKTYNPNAPVVFNCEFGHTYPTCPIPIGGEVEIEPATKSIRFP